MKYTIRKSVVQVLGEIWQPGAGPCAMDFTLTDHDVEMIGTPKNRECVGMWLDMHAGDFSRIIDFSASIEQGEETIDLPWADEENEMTYNDAMFGAE